MKVASHQLEYGLYSYGVCEGVLLNFIISTDDKLSCIYINILKRGDIFMETYNMHSKFFACRKGAIAC